MRGPAAAAPPCAATGPRRRRAGRGGRASSPPPRSRRPGSRCPGRRCRGRSRGRARTSTGSSRPGSRLRRRRDADAAGDARPQVAEDVAEQVRGDDDVEARCGSSTSRGGERVDEHLLGTRAPGARDVAARTLVPERHRVDDPVGLRGADQMRPRAAARPARRRSATTRSVPRRVKIELLDRQLVVGAAVQSGRRLGVLALGVLAHDDEVDVRRSATRAAARGSPGSSCTGRRFTYCRKARRIGISSPHSETWSGTSGRPTAPRRIASLARSAPARPPASSARSRRSGRSPTGARQRPARAVRPAGRLQHLQRGRRDLPPDPVAGHDCNAIAPHAMSRIPLLGLPHSRAISSAGRAPPRQGGGHWFEPSIAHSLRGLLVTEPEVVTSEAEAERAGRTEPLVVALGSGADVEL